MANTHNGKVVAAYLNSLKAGRGRGVSTPAQIEGQIRKVKQTLNVPLGSVARLKLIQKQIDLVKKLEAAKKAHSKTLGLQKLEEDFIRIAPEYSKQNGLSNTAWRRVGVPGHVLIKAGLSKPRTRRK